MRKRATRFCSHHPFCPGSSSRGQESLQVEFLEEFFRTDPGRRFHIDSVLHEMRGSKSQPANSEKEIIERWRKGDKRAFEHLVKRHMHRAYFIALGFVGQHDDALDLSQEAFVRMYRHRKRFDPRRPFFPWFYQVLKNLCFNWLRRRKAQRYTSLEELRERNGEFESRDSFDPNLIAGRDALKDAVWKAMFELEPHEREIIILRHFENLSYREISEVLLCKEGTVMSRLYYARRALRAKLQKALDMS